MPRHSGSLTEWRSGQVLFCEGVAGVRRRRLLSRIAARLAHRPPARVWLLDCAFASGGVWAGVQDLISSVVREIRAVAPSLVVEHDHELLQVLPELAASLSRRFPTLTDLSTGEERVRGYPADRAFRSVHGLIDLLAEWKALASDDRWIVACDGFDACSTIGQFFFRELIRRRGRALNLDLIVAVDPSNGESVEESFTIETRGPRIRFQLKEEPLCEEPRESVRARATALDRDIGNDYVQIRKRLARMVDLWERAGDPQMILKWNLLGLEMCTEDGLYSDALVYGTAARRLAKELHPEDGDLRWMVFFKLFSCYMALRDAPAALALAREDALGRTERPEWRSQLYYLMAMLYARYLTERDFAKAEDFLERGLEELERASLSAERYHFGVVFNRNGLAMVRHFQGRHAEAIALCQSSFARLGAHLDERKHKLHRSVLLYNLAQVYAAIGSVEEALGHYSAAIAMDPNYSEYYNERGNLLLKKGATAEALSDYRRAVELSPPYFEVTTNLGQCYRQMGRLEEATLMYSRALDLMPDQPLALLGRAQAHEAMGGREEAIDDYTRALAIAPKQWEARANRAVLYYEAGRLELSLDDLDAAIRLAPDQADLYSNRALVLADLGFLERAVRDLEDYLRLNPDAPDRLDTEKRLASLQAAARPLLSRSSVSAGPPLGDDIG